MTRAFLWWLTAKWLSNPPLVYGFTLLLSINVAFIIAMTLLMLSLLRQDLFRGFNEA